jgi:hypothetical protein
VVFPLSLRRSFFFTSLLRVQNTMLPYPSITAAPDVYLHFPTTVTASRQFLDMLQSRCLTVMKLKSKIILAVIGLSAIFGYIQQATSHSQVAGLQTTAPTATPTLTDTPTPTVTPTPTLSRPLLFSITRNQRSKRINKHNLQQPLSISAIIPTTPIQMVIKFTPLRTRQTAAYRQEQPRSV